MAIKDLQPKQGGANVEGVITELGDVREFQKFGKPGRVANAMIKDESGVCKLSLWNEQIDLVKVGDKIKITDGYANEWQGELQLSTGRNGTIEVLESGAAVPEAAPAEEALAEEPAESGAKPNQDPMVEEETIE